MITATLKGMVQKYSAKPGVITEQESEFTDEDDIPLAQLLADAFVPVNINQPMSADSYKDNNIPATEELPVCWEGQLAVGIRIECVLNKSLASEYDDDTSDSLSVNKTSTNLHQFVFQTGVSCFVTFILKKYVFLFTYI